MSKNKGPIPDDDLDKYIAQLEPLNMRASLLHIFNGVSLIVPVIAVMLPELVPPIGEPANLLGSAAKLVTTEPGNFLAAAGANAITVQISRWQKNKLRSEFEKTLKDANPDNVDMVLGGIRHTFDTIVDKSTSLISHKDINWRERLSLVPLFGTAATAFLYAPISPMMFFIGSQIRETFELNHLANSISRSTSTLKSIKNDID